MEAQTILHFETNAGFLQNCRVAFTPGLNCIIGARGTCKSTLIESILFAFNYDEERIEELTDRSSMKYENAARGMITSTLQAGTVSIGVEHNKASRKSSFTIEREVGSTPRVYQDGVREYADPKSVLQLVEIYSQGDLLNIAKDESRRIQLIDRPNRIQIDAWKIKRDEVAARLAIIGNKIRDIKAQIKQLDFESKDLHLRRQELLDTIASRPTMPPGMQEQIDSEERRQATLSVLEGLGGIKTELVQHANAASTFLDQIGRIEASIVALGSFEPELVGVMECVAQLRDAAADLIAASPRIQEIDVEGEIARLRQAFSKVSEDYYRVRREQNAVNEALKREDQLRKQVDHLERISTELMRLRHVEAELLDQRQQCRAEIKVLGEEIYAVRVAEIDAINSQHSEFVLLSLVPGTQSQAYARLLSEILKGSRIQSQEEVAKELMVKTSPTELIEIVESGNHQALASLLERDLNQSARIVTHLEYHPQLYTVESQIPDDVLDISMYDSGVPKPVSSLSNGQKATALLPLILRPLPYPLIIDQPEDDLDNRFVFKSLVTTVRKLKSDRQIIFVTHNANIPVLGEADRVIVMSMRGPFEANPPSIGSVDERAEDIVGLLEGGREAFLERQHRYQAMLTMP